MPGSVERDAKPEVSIEGTVLSSFGGAVIAGATLVFEHAAGTTSTTSAADGAFALTSREGGVYSIAMVTAPGYLAFAPAWGSSPTSFLLRPGDRVRGVVVTLEPSQEYRGAVRSPDGRPVEGAEVRVLSPSANDASSVEAMRSDAKGEFTFHASDEALVEARAAGFAPGRARVDWAVRASRHIVVRLAPATAADETLGTGIIAGQVLGSDGMPAPGALVGARFESSNPAETTPHPSPTVSSDDGGRFVLRGLDAGPHTVVARYADLALARAEGVRTGTNGLTLRLTTGGSVVGAVTDQVTSKPVVSFSIILLAHRGPVRREPYAARSFVDAQGRYEMRGLSSGDYDLTVAASGYGPSKPVDVAIPDPPGRVVVNVALSRGATIRGRVVESGTATPLAGARVEFEGTVESDSSGVATARAALTGSDGSFELRGVSAGARSLSATAPGHDGRIVSGLTVPDNGDLGPLTIELGAIPPGQVPAFELTGIGVALAPKGDALIVGQVFPGSGAEAAGMAAGDAILGVDGESVVALGFEGAIQSIRGPEGSTVDLLVEKGGKAPPLDVTVTRVRIRH